MNAKLDHIIRAAIDQRCLLEFSYDMHPRTVEPHDYGVHKGAPKVLCYQVGGRSGSGKIPDWRTFMLEGIKHVRVTATRFAGPRPVVGRHIAWEELFASVSRQPFSRGR